MQRCFTRAMSLGGLTNIRTTKTDKKCKKLYALISVTKAIIKIKNKRIVIEVMTLNLE